MEDDEDEELKYEPTVVSVIDYAIINEEQKKHVSLKWRNE